MKDILLLFLIIISFPFKNVALENPEIKENPTFYYVYMRFDGYHSLFNEFELLFFKLIKNYYKNKKIAISIYDGSAQNIPSFLELVSSYIDKKNYYWDGPLIINEITNQPGNSAYESVIPLSINLYQVFIKPYGIVKVLITFICLL